MKRCAVVIIMLCLSILVFSACREEPYYFSETRDFSEYSPSFDFFPSIVEGEVLSFGDASYNYWSHSEDEFLVLKFHSREAFSTELERIMELKTRYAYHEKENYLVQGYDSIFFMCSFSSEEEESLACYIPSAVYSDFYCIDWNLVMVSEEEMTVIYNLLNYDTRNFEKWGEREAYVTEYFGLNLEEIAREISQGA